MRYLSILEVSQKQAYIFGSNKLKDNIARSNEIAYITGTDFIQKTVNNSELFDKEKNLVYAGGGHTILEFPKEENAKTVIQKISYQILKDFPEIELFAKTILYEESKTPGENVKELTAALEKKKALRKASFHQISFGVERIDTNTKMPVQPGKTSHFVMESKNEAPKGFIYSQEFENLGGKKNEKNFIAVVHIDGNAMGKRIEKLLHREEMQNWQGYKTNMRAFSENMAKQFMESYRAMEEKLAKSPVIKELDLEDKKHNCTYFPVRRVISEGDDICFVSEGRIGIECASLLLKELSKKVNPIDGKPYAACAGVALVHQKYPFYRAYELAEELCSNAKKLGPSVYTDDSGSELSCIDWHIEYGEMQDSLSETRKQYQVNENLFVKKLEKDKENYEKQFQYIANNSNEKYLTTENTEEKVKIKLEMRPYVVVFPKEKAITEELSVRNYENFCRLMEKINSADDEGLYSRGLLKELRSVLKKGSKATEYYLRFHKMEEIGRDFYYGIFKNPDISKENFFTGKGMKYKIFVFDGKDTVRSILFDGIECMDTWLKVGDRDEN